MHTRHAISLTFVLIISLQIFPAHAAETSNLRLASPFSNNAILQRDMKLPIWGWAKPGSKITVRFANQTKSTTTSKTGKWLLKLDPLNASLKPQTLTVSTSGQTLKRHNILVGEVWFSSGQSNMDWIASKSMCRQLASTLQRANPPLPIREFTVDTGSSLYPALDAASKDGWKSSKSAGSFSALSLAFAHELYRQLEVPIGILRSTHGATPIETWTPYEGFASNPHLKDITLKIRQTNTTTLEGKKAFDQYFKDLKAWQIQSEKIINRGGTALPRPKLPGIAEDWKGPTRMFNKKIAPLIPYAIRGAIWCQGTHNANDGKIYAHKMHALINGWRKKWNRPNLPFYFTQMQCYGKPDPNNVGFADIREAQTRFFLTAENVGMVPQYDLNPARPSGIHYFNKLDPGKRLARWALAHQYNQDIPYTGPIYKSHTIEGDTVRVHFEQRGFGGDLMIGSKGLQSDPANYFEPAQPDPNQPLKHFRLAGKDKIWHPATAVIEDNQVVVRSKHVPKPVGVQYAYSASPIGANLYNKAGLPATPFAYFNGKQMFNEDDPKIVAAAKAYAKKRWGKRSYLLPSTLFRDNAVLQRNKPIHVWGHAVPKTKITVTFAGQSKTTTVNEFEYWSLTLDPIPASTKPRDLNIICSNGEKRIVKNILVGDIWIITGSRQLDGQLIRHKKGEIPNLKPLPHVREFRIKTKARRFRTPRKLRMEIGGGRYVASWQPADFDNVGDPPSIAAYHFAAQIRKPDIPLGIITLGAENPPITWVSYNAMQTAPGFEAERDNLNLAYPNTDACKKAITQYIQTIKRYNQDIATLLKAGAPIPPKYSDQAPPFPQPYYNQWQSRTETPTHTYNFCISPLTPFAITGLIWIPGRDNISSDIKKYAPSLKLLAQSTPKTFGQPSIQFLYAHPTPSLVKGITNPNIPNAKMIPLTNWPKSFKDITTNLGQAAVK